MFFPFEASPAAVTNQVAARSTTVQSSSGTSIPSTRAGPVVSAAMTVSSAAQPASTPPSRSGSAVSRPEMPNAARSYSTSFFTDACGAWSVAIASIVPSASASQSARTSPSVRSGGFTFVDASNGVARGDGRPSHATVRSPATQASVSARWCGVTSHVTARPSAFARRTSSTERAVDTCCRCRRAPLSFASARSRAIAASSEAAGIPGRPRSAETRPSCMTPRAESARSCGCSKTGRSAARAYSSALRKRRASSTGEPSSEKATAPAAASSTRSASSFPLRPRVIVATGSTRAAFAAFARATSSAMRPGESIAGSVFGIAQTVVNPPRSAARAPLAMVSESSKPGSRRCTWRSMNPGTTR